MSGITLYSFHKSSCSWRIRILLNLKRLTYEYKAVRLAGQGGDQEAPEFKALNPSAQVPVLLIDGEYLHESVAIAEYVEETRPELRPLYPKDAISRAHVRSVVEMINAGIQPKQNLSTLNFVAGDNDAKRAWAVHWNTKGLAAVEQALQRWSDGRYCIGSEVSFADCCLVPQVYSAHVRFKIDVPSLFPTVWKVFTHLNTMPEVQAAHADCQPDGASA